MAQEKYLGENGLKRLVGLVKEDLGTKANIDGSYDTMQVGSAKQLVSPTGITDTTPYVFRTTCGETSISGGDEQLASLKAIRGNTIVWNQNALPCTSDKWSTQKSYGTLTDATATSVLYTRNQTDHAGNVTLMFQAIEGGYGSIAGHKYLIKCIITPSATFKFRAYIGTYGNVYNPVANVKNYFTEIITANSNGYLQFISENGGHLPLGGTVLFENIQLFDLGPGNEPTSVLEFTRLFPKLYYPFNPGEIRNAKTTGLKTTGYNAFTGTFEKDGTSQYIRSNTFIRVVGGQTYSFEDNGFTDYQFRHIVQFDYNKQEIENTNAANASYDVPAGQIWTLKLNPNTVYVKLQFAYWELNHYTSLDVSKVNPCFHLTHSGSRTGYAPHEEHVLHIDTSRYFPDGMNGFGTAYDELTSKHASKRIAKVDLGTLEWLRSSDGMRMVSESLRYIIKLHKNYWGYPNLLCAKYTLDTPGNLESSSPTDKTISIGGNGYAIAVYDSDYTDPTAFKQAMSRVYLYYELKEPEVTEIPQVRDNHWEIKVDDYGTEEWLFPEGDEIPVPVGHETLYMDNLVDKLRNLPDPSEYKALESELQTWVKLPPLPTDTSKVYVPKFVNGTIQWVEE